ncbi:MAG: FAD-binding oxidoreductase [Myxococcales bacterium]
MNGLREDLSATGSAVLAEGEGLRVTPPSVAALGRAVAVLRAHLLPVRVRGNGDAPVEAPAGGALLELTALDRIASVDGATGIARVEAGCSVAALETAARRAGATLGPLLPSVRSGSVGAWLAGPTRGERAVPGCRRETAALSVSAVLADGRLAESRAAPRSATGPDLDHLALGGSGRLCVIAAAWVRLFPAARPAYAAWRAPDLGSAVRMVEQLCADRLGPARGMVRLRERGALIALSWEGPESARLLRTRAVRALGPPVEMDAGPEVRAPASSRAIEVDARWSALHSFAAHPGAAEIALYGMHAGGAFAVLSLGEEGVEQSADAARAYGARLVAPRRLRAARPAWEAMGAGPAWDRLVTALGAEERR